MADAATWTGVGISAVALGVSLWTRITLSHRTRLDAIHTVLSHWETGSRLRNVTTATDTYNPGLSKSVKTWRAVCQSGLEVLRAGPRRDMIREAQKAAIPVDSLLDRALLGGVTLTELDQALQDMQDAVETHMMALAAAIGRSLEPRQRETYP